MPQVLSAQRTMMSSTGCDGRSLLTTRQVLSDSELYVLTGFYFSSITSTTDNGQESDVGNHIYIWPLTLYEHKGNCATSNNMKLVHWSLMGGLLHLVQWGGDCMGGAAACPCFFLAVPNVTANSPPINGQCTNHRMLYNGPLLCGFNVANKGLKSRQ